MKNYTGAELIERARKETGLDRFDDESFREGLDLYLSDYNTNPRSEDFNERNAAYVTKILSDRLRIEDALRRRPEVLQGPVERPVFVFGVPRTGTTLLSNLLAADPARRSALTWEIEHPVPPPTTATLKTDPRCLAMLEQEREMQAATNTSSPNSDWRRTRYATTSRTIWPPTMWSRKVDRQLTATA